MQDPDGAAAFCHHHNIMTNVSFPNWKKNIGLAARMIWMLQMNKISFVEDSLDCMTTKCQKCVVIVLCTKIYYRTLQ